MNVPRMMNDAWWCSDPWSEKKRRASPAASSTAPAVANRWAGRGRAGRPDSAATTEVRATARAGHHAAATAVNAARTRVAATAHHGSANRSIRWPDDRLQRRHEREPRRQADHPTGDSAYHPDGGAVGQHHQADVLVGGAERGQHAEGPLAPLGHDGEPGDGHQADEQQADGPERQHQGVHRRPCSAGHAS